MTRNNHVPKSLIDRSKTVGYVRTHVDTEAGRRSSFDCADEVAVLLRGKNLEELGHIAELFGLKGRFDETWSTMSNVGLTRMALGNAIRQKKKRDETAAA